MSHLNAIPKINDSNKPFKNTLSQGYIECFSKSNSSPFLRMRLTTKKALQISKLSNVKDAQMLIPEIKNELIRRINIHIPFGGKNKGRFHIFIFDENKNQPHSFILY